MDKKLQKYILDVVMGTIGKAMTIQSFKGGNWSDEEILEVLNFFKDGEYILATEFCTESAEKCVIMVNNITEKGLLLHEELRGIED